MVISQLPDYHPFNDELVQAVPVSPLLQSHDRPPPFPGSVLTQQQVFKGLLVEGVLQATAGLPHTGTCGIIQLT